MPESYFRNLCISPNEYKDEKNLSGSSEIKKELESLPRPFYRVQVFFESWIFAHAVALRKSFLRR